MLTARVSYAVILAGACLALVPATADAQKRERDRITRAEILASPAKERDLYEVIRGLRPHFVEAPRWRKGTRSMGNTQMAPIAVYVDDKKDSGLDALRTLLPTMVDEVRYLEPTASANRFGPTVNGGALMVKLYREPKVTPPKIDSTSSR
jgi:hypothetical protein